MEWDKLLVVFKSLLNPNLIDTIPLIIYVICCFFRYILYNNFMTKKIEILSPLDVNMGNGDTLITIWVLMDFYILNAKSVSAGVFIQKSKNMVN